MGGGTALPCGVHRLQPLHAPTPLRPACGVRCPIAPPPHHHPAALQIVTGYGEAGHALVTSPDVAKVVFVGSTQIGRKVRCQQQQLHARGRVALVACVERRGGGASSGVLAPCIRMRSAPHARTHRAAAAHPQ